MQRISCRDCDFESYFSTKPFVSDKSLQLDYCRLLSKDLKNVEDRVLSEIRRGTSDFECCLETECVQGGTIHQVLKGTFLSIVKCSGLLLSKHS
jgi:hypothetical protein